MTDTGRYLFRYQEMKRELRQADATIGVLKGALAAEIVEAIAVPLWAEHLMPQGRAMMGALIAMAETGSPNTAAIPWAQWSAKNETMLVLGDKVAPEKFNLAGQAWLAANPPKVAAPDPATGRPRD